MHLPGEKRYDYDERPPRGGTEADGVLRSLAFGSLIVVGLAALVALIVISEGAFDLPTFWRKDDGDGPTV